MNFMGLSNNEIGEVLAGFGLWYLNVERGLMLMLSEIMFFFSEGLIQINRFVNKHLFGGTIEPMQVLDSWFWGIC